MPTSSTTKARDFWDARRRGERLPEHERPAERCEPPQPECDFCTGREPIDPDASDAAGHWVCTACVETFLQGACYELAHQAH